MWPFCSLTIKYHCFVTSHPDYITVFEHKLVLLVWPSVTGGWLQLKQFFAHQWSSSWRTSNQPIIQFAKCAVWERAIEGGVKERKNRVKWATQGEQKSENNGLEQSTSSTGVLAVNVTRKITSGRFSLLPRHIYWLSKYTNTFINTQLQIHRYTNTRKTTN